MTSDPTSPMSQTSMPEPPTSQAPPARPEALEAVPQTPADPAADPAADLQYESSAASALPARSGRFPTQPVIARAGQYYRNTRYIMAALTVVMGFWFGYDGFVRWPAENVKIIELRQKIADARAANDANAAALAQTELKKHSPHSGTDLQFQKILAFALPPLGILLLAWALYNSRGEYRLADNTLHVPGHPPIPLACIRELDEQEWDRKGIAVVRYELSNGHKGVVKLDDFVYDRPPTDDIYDLIKAHVQADAAKSPATEPPTV